ncbi:hypothetical protein GEMRC1_011157 [Eukaryota sp. GEM-RC1]
MTTPTSFARSAMSAIPDTPPHFSIDSVRKSPIREELTTLQSPLHSPSPSPKPVPKSKPSTRPRGRPKKTPVTSKNQSKKTAPVKVFKKRVISKPSYLEVESEEENESAFPSFDFEKLSNFQNIDESYDFDDVEQASSPIDNVDVDLPNLTGDDDVDSIIMGLKQVLKQKANKKQQAEVNTFKSQVVAIQNQMKKVSSTADSEITKIREESENLKNHVLETSAAGSAELKSLLKKFNHN